MSLLAWSQAIPPASASTSLVKASSKNLNPPGFTTLAPIDKKQKGKGKDLVAQAGNSAEILVTKSWELATSPAKQIPMQAIMLYMSGSTVQIFSMLSIGMLFKSSLNGVASTEQAFARFSQPGLSLLLQKLVFIACNLGLFALGVWKCQSMGLLPTASSDWLAWKAPALPLELSPLRA